MIKTRKLKIRIEGMDEFRKRVGKELRAIDKREATRFSEDSISFQSLDQLRKFLTPKRLELLKVIRHKKPQSIYELAKLVGRTPENVNTDIKFLKQLGFVEITKVKKLRQRVIPKVGYDKIILEIDI